MFNSVACIFDADPTVSLPLMQEGKPLRQLVGGPRPVIYQIISELVLGYLAAGSDGTGRRISLLRQDLLLLVARMANDLVQPISS